MIFKFILATFAAWRITELITLDAISAPLRKFYPKIAACPRCASVWAGGVATLFALYAPYLNWALALSWLYLERGVVASMLNESLKFKQGRLQIDSAVANAQLAALSKTPETPTP